MKIKPRVREELSPAIGSLRAPFRSLGGLGNLKPFAFAEGEPARGHVERYGELLDRADHGVALALLDQKYGLSGHASGIPDISKREAEVLAGPCETNSHAAPGVMVCPIARARARGLEWNGRWDSSMPEPNRPFFAVREPRRRKTERVADALNGRETRNALAVLHVDDRCPANTRHRCNILPQHATGVDSVARALSASKRKWVPVSGWHKHRYETVGPMGKPWVSLSECRNA